MLWLNEMKQAYTLLHGKRVHQQLGIYQALQDSSSLTLLLGSTLQTMATCTTKQPLVPGSHKAEGAKNLWVPNSYIYTYNISSLKDQNRLEELENVSETRFKWNVRSFFKNEKEGRASGAPKHWACPIHKRRRKISWRSWTFG